MVRDIQDPNPAVAQTLYALEESLDRSLLQRRSRLVENQEARADGQSAGDLNNLALFDGQPAGLLVDVDVEAPLQHHVVRPLPHAAPVDDRAAVAVRRPVQEHVLGHRQGRHHHRLLVHAGDLGQPGAPVGEAGRRLSAKADGSAIGAGQPREKCYQRGLAGAVPPHQTVAFTRGDAQGDIDERLGLAEGLEGAFRLADRIGCTGEPAARRPPR